MGINTRNILDVFAKLIRALECPVCYDYVSSPIWQCNAGHIICGSCKSKISNCPTCRESFSSARVRSLEQISDIMIFPCLNEGCEQMLPLNEIHLHEERCTLSGARGNLDGEAKTMVVQYNILKHIENNIAPFFVTTNNNKECETVKMRKDASTWTDDIPSEYKDVILTKFGFVKATDLNNQKTVKESTYCSSINKINLPKNHRFEKIDSNSHQSNNTIFHFNANVNLSNNNDSTLFSNAKNSTRYDPNKKFCPTTSWRFYRKELPRKTSQTSKSTVSNLFSSTGDGSNSLLNENQCSQNNCESGLTFSKLSTDIVPHSVKPTFGGNIMSASSSQDDSSIENNSPTNVTPSLSAAVGNDESPISDIITLTNSLSFTPYLDNNNVSQFKNFSADATNTCSNSNYLPSSSGLSTCEINDNKKIMAFNENASVSDRCSTNKHILRNTIFTFNNNITISTPTLNTVSGNMFSGIDICSNRGSCDTTSFGNLLCKDIPKARTSSSDNRPISFTEYINRSREFRDNIKMLPTENQSFIKPKESLSGNKRPPEIQSSSARSANTGTLLPCLTDNISFENLNISSKNSEKGKQPYKIYKPNETLCFKFCKSNDSLQRTLGIFQFQG